MQPLNEKLCKNISKSLDVGIIVLDRFQNILFCNTWIEERLPSDNKEILTLNIYSAFPDIENTRLSATINEAIELGLPAIVSNIFNRSPLPLYKDANNKIYQNINIIPFDEENLNYVIIQVNDVSASVQREKAFEKQAKERKKVEVKLREALEELEKVSNTKSEFLASMSHEIRTPMNGIVGLSQLLRNTELTALQKNYLSTIDESVTLLLTVINDILDFSKLESGKLQLNDIDFKFNGIVNGILDILYLNIKNNDIEISVDIDNKLNAFFVGDDNRIKQVLLNILTNAIKFTKKGDIDIKLECIEDKLNSAVIKASITDTGIGISEDVQNKLFEKFTQADSSTTRKYGGTGLGLAICKNIIELMGGDIGFESKVNIGSTFWFTIELIKSSKQVIDQVHSIEAVDLNLLMFEGTVLLVDDVLVNQIVAQAMLEELGFNVITAENGQDAIEKYKNQVFTLILMDCQMPIMDGFEATKNIRELEDDKHTPIIALTALAMKGDDELCLNAGMDDYISKPYDLPTLRATLSKWV